MTFSTPQQRVASLQVISSGTDVRRAVMNARRAGKTIGLVPTMGALHEGHFSLVRRCRAECDVAVVSIFVNPTQFGPNEDFSKYPRTLEEDRRQLEQIGADILFTPSGSEMYPAGYSTYVEPPRVAEPLEGRCRPGHFRGVTTVVLKLFQLVPADVSYFGHKDYQQSVVIQAMCRDLNVPVRISVCPTVRESDGLAMSSRNRYLNERERQQALALSRSLELAQRMVAAGERQVDRIVQRMQEELASAGIARVDYATLADPETLEPLIRIDRPVVALVAAYVGGTRLIDNRRIQIATC